MRLKILLCFDHELSLGGWDSYDRNLFDPTYALMESAAEAKVPLVFFTDVLCAMRFRDWDHDGFYVPYTRQIHRMLQEGHDVQLHLHPHWVDSRYDADQYTPSSSYSFSAFEADGQRIEEIIREGVKFLNCLCCEIDKGYRCLAYRAGGYNLSPQDRVLPALYQQGIRFDSSVVKGLRFAAKHSSVDFTRCPSRPAWTFPPQGPVTKEADSDFWEIPLVAVPRNWLNNIPFLIRRVLYRSRAYSGRGRRFHEGGRGGRLAKLRRLFPHSSLILSFELYTHSPAAIMQMLNHYVRRHRGHEVICCSTCSHPKNMGPYNRKLMVEFVQRVRDTYGQNADFLTFPQLNRQINNLKPVM